jgi:hypothetical protein
MIRRAVGVSSLSRVFAGWLAAPTNGISRRALAAVSRENRTRARAGGFIVNAEVTFESFLSEPGTGATGAALSRFYISPVLQLTLLPDTPLDTIRPDFRSLNLRAMIFSGTMV